MAKREKSTTTVTIPPPTAQEVQLNERVLQLADFQISELAKQAGFTEDFLGNLETLFEPLTSALNAAIAELPSVGADIEGRAEASEELLQRQLDLIRSGGAPSDRERALIQQAADAAISAGRSDIEQAADLQLERIREELGPSLGLRPGDTPLIDRGQRVGAEAVRNVADLSTTIRGQQAQALLNRPFQTGAFIQNQQAFLESIRQFQAQLRESAFVNRLSLTGGLLTGGGTLGLGLATGVPVNAAAASQGLAQVRAAQATQKTTGRATGASVSEIGGLVAGTAEGVGSAAGGIAAVAALSSRAFKDGKTPVDEDKILEALRNLPVEFWHYLDDVERKHIGPYAEDFQARFGVGDGVTIQFIDAIGVLTAAMKALDRKVTADRSATIIDQTGNTIDDFDLDLRAA